jgi:hypothetical protein
MLGEMSEPMPAALPGEQWLSQIYGTFLSVPPQRLVASVGGVSQMLASLCQAQRAGMVSPETAIRTRERLSTLLLSLLQQDPPQPTTTPAAVPPPPTQTLVGAAAPEDGAGVESDGASQDWAQDGGKKSLRLSGATIGEDEHVYARATASLSERGQVQLLEDLSSALLSLRSLAWLLRRDGVDEDDESSTPAAASENGDDIALVCDVVMERAAQVVGGRRSNAVSLGREDERAGTLGGGGLRSLGGGDAKELRSTVKLLRFVAGAGAEQGRRDKHKRYARELVARVQQFDAASASGVVVADVMEAAQLAGAMTPALLHWVARTVAGMSVESWLSGSGGSWARGGGASLSRVLASIITLQNQLLRRFPRHERLVLLSNDKDAQGMLAAISR